MTMRHIKDIGRTAKLLNWLRSFSVAGVLLLCLLAILLLALNVWRELAALERLSAYNTQWALVQTEVETLRLQLAVEQAIAKGEDATFVEVRRWFDVVYSRIGMLPDSQNNVENVKLPEFAANIGLMQAFLNRTVPLIDGSDGELLAGLPILAEALPTVRHAARQMTLQARARAAVSSDSRRAEVIATLLALAGLTAFLLVALSALSLFLLRLMRRGDAQMRQSHLTSARLQTIFSTSADAIIVTNRGGWIVDINPAAEAMFGHARRDALGRHAMDLLLPPEVAMIQSKEITTILETAASRPKGNEDGPLRIELLGLRADGGRIPVELSLGAMQLETGGVVVALVRDISDRRMAQTALTSALELAQAGERTKADFIAVMSHEMRTPLNGLLGSLELLAASDLRTGQRDLVDVMASSGQILLHHVNSVLEITKAEADGAAEAGTDFDLDKLIDNCVANQAGLAATKGLTIAIVPMASPLGWVHGDPTRLRQILLNLIGNAVKFTSHGRITIEAERPEYGHPVEIRVIDTGKGIPEADLVRVFDDFVTLNARYDRPAEGTGLGLGIARRVARAMGGEIGVESVLGDGSLFWLRLPLPEVNAAAPQSTAEPIPGEKPALQVLVIEDNPVNRFVLRRLLEESGHAVEEADNGTDGVLAANSRAFDVIMTDISMPGLDGVEVTRRVRQHPGPSQHARVVAVTAHALPVDLIRFREAGIDDCMTKPITRVTLMAALTEPAKWAVPMFDDVILDHAQIADLTARLGGAATAALIARVISEGDTADADHLWSSGLDGAKRLHALVGTAGTFGARRLQSGLVSLQAAQGSDDRAAIACLMDAMPHLWQSTRAALDAEMLNLLSDQPIATAASVTASRAVT